MDSKEQIVAWITMRGDDRDIDKALDSMSRRTKIHTVRGVFHGEFGEAADSGLRAACGARVPTRENCLGYLLTPADTDGLARCKRCERKGDA